MCVCVCVCVCVYVCVSFSIFFFSFSFITNFLLSNIFFEKLNCHQIVIITVTSVAKNT